ncbi:energy-coupling factor ABC transporter substrate-binding protein [Caloramator sp. CAR-1]|jgi:cobalt/nickel transport protein|uniref:energy-coupling factor ABC transporter substrate-binding protein n=1 Tax=Caloramator sp. CAR-1 TaxID=3062777 RepID=UPI0005909388|nr:MULTISPECIES: energy-coupling factor ABC transporter substrate-binding protein [Caloramator]MDO6355300.1 energy-coupling factor ABC transporter substrate-binding protein [Caloramator sp. CAR-1]
MGGKTVKRNWLLGLIACLIIITSLLIGSQRGDLGGADDKAQDVISEVAPDYKPYFNSIFEPPSGEIESLIFALQSAGGAFIIGYVLGRKKNDKRDNLVFKEQQS